MYRFHFLGSAVEEITLEEQGQPNLRAFAAHREGWKRTRMVINQSKIRRTINTFKPLKSAGIDDVLAVLQQ